MQQLPGWFAIIAAFALLGGAIDFFIGKKGQTKVRDWLELRWYKTADIAWTNFGQKEARAYLDVIDSLVGK